MDDCPSNLDVGMYIIFLLAVLAAIEVHLNPLVYPPPISRHAMIAILILNTRLWRVSPMRILARRHSRYCI